MRLCTPHDVASHLLPTVYGWERVDAGDQTREFDFEYGSCGCGLAILAVQKRRSLVVIVGSRRADDGEAQDVAEAGALAQAAGVDRQLRVLAVALLNAVEAVADEAGLDCTQALVLVFQVYSTSSRHRPNPSS
jgi:hypothetical protein